MRIRSYFLVLLLALLGPTPAGAQPILDGFVIGNTGSVSISGAGVRAVAVQSGDAKVVIGGQFSITGGSVTLQNLARLNPDGTLDTGFQPPAPDGAVLAVALQSDPADPSGPPLVVIGGDFSRVGGTLRNGLARLNGSDGSLDSFNPATSATPVRVNALALPPDGTSVLVGGSFGEIAAGRPSPNLARISLALPDPGAAAWSYSAGLDGAVNAILLQGGRVVVGGAFGAPTPNLTRFNADGTPDGSFGTLAPGGAVLALALQADGKLLVAGAFSGGTLGRNFLARLAKDGTLDTGFSPNPDASVRSILVRPDGKIVVAGDFTALGASAALRLGRLSIAGTAESAQFPALDAAVRALALQADGKVLAGGDFSLAGTTPRTRLARFYPGGGLDDDNTNAHLDLDWAVSAIMPHPDGSTTFAGLFTVVQTLPRVYLARLRDDWNLVENAAMDPSVKLNGAANVIAPLPDRSFLLGGSFFLVNGVPQRNVVRLDYRGNPNGSAAITTFNANVKTVMGAGQANAMVPLPLGSTLPDGTPLEEGMIYIGGNLNPVVSPYRYLARFKDSGLRDASFTPSSEVDGTIYSLALQSDYKLWVGTKTGKLVRLKSNGNLDVSLNSTLTGVYSILQQRDGLLVVTGQAPPLGAYPGYQRSVLRMAVDGTIDESFRVETRTVNNEYISGSYVMRAVLQADGSMIIYGAFDHVRGSDGAEYLRDCVARVKPDGSVDADFDPGPLVYHGGGIIGQMNTAVLLQDGKVALGGDFDSVNGSFPQRMARFNNGWSAEKVVVAQDGTSATWLRSGTVPELRLVWFEYCEDPDAPGAIWSFLGYAQPVAGGWQLSGLDLAQYGVKANRYLRARGRVSGDKGGAGAIFESVRLYYLDPAQQTVVTVTADTLSKVYGDPDPPLGYSFNPALAPGDSFTGALTREPGEAVGLYAIGPGTLSAGPNYTVNVTGASLAITPRCISVTASAAGKTYGDPEPVFDYSFAPALVGGDTFSGALARTPGETAGSYPIGLGTLSLSGNYALSYLAASFTVAPKQVAVRAQPGEKRYGAADPPLDYSYSPALVGTDSFSGALERAPGESVAGGPYPIRQGTLTLGSNYSISYFEDRLAITKAPLTVAVEDKTRAYQTPNPPLTVRYSGFVRGEGASVLFGAPQLSTPALLSSPVGGYPITAGLGTLAAANYSLEMSGGTLNVTKSCQEIVFPQPGDRTYGDPPFTIDASACSGLSLSFASSNPQVATVSGNLVTVTGAGSVVLSASQEGSGDLDRAGDVSRTLLVHRAGQTLNFDPLPGKIMGESPFALNATASSGLPVSHQSSDPAVAEVSGNLVTLRGAGTTVITARQTGDGNFNAALPVSQTLVVSQETVPPLLTLSTLPPGAVTANPVLNLAGFASDVSGILSLTVNGSRVADPAGFFTSAVLLAPGENSTEVALRDGAGNLSSWTFGVRLDPNVPQLDLVTPADNGVTNDPALMASGTAAPGSLVQVALNGSVPQTLAAADGSFTWSGSLRPGLNTMVFSAEASGRRAQLKRSVTLATGQPAVAILEPAQDVRTEQGSLTIRGAVGGGATGVTLEAGGTRFTPPVQGGTFQQALLLEGAGAYRIKVSASDVLGNTSQSVRNVIRVELIRGDLNGDGCVDIRDAQAALRVSLGLDPATRRVLAHADVAPLLDGIPRPDGIIDAGDVLLILRKIVGVVDF